LSSIQQLLDSEFNISSNDEDLVAFAITENNRIYINSDFLNGTTGLFTKTTEEIQLVATTVFLTDVVLRNAVENTLLFTHHHFNYYENERGLQPLTEETMITLKKKGISIFVCHAPLDTHKIYGTSVALAQHCEIIIDELFYDYYSAPTALLGHINEQPIDVFTDNVMRKLDRLDLTVKRHRENAKRIGVVAGGGDIPEILQYAYDKDCDTLLTGTIVNRWNLPFLQETNKKMHDLNKKLKMNLIGGTHYGTERPAMINVLDLFRKNEIECSYIEDDDLKNFRDIDLK
jgi:putative NIF3 family GTP cyclohydrolase 1 type 2